jgi:hypothetical protein
MNRVSQVEVQLPSWKWRLVVTVLTIAVAWMLVFAYESVQGPLEAKAAVQQLEDSVQAYAVSRTWAASDVTGAIKCIAAVMLGFLWVPYTYRLSLYMSAQEKV